MPGDDAAVDAAAEARGFPDLQRVDGVVRLPVPAEVRGHGFGGVRVDVEELCDARRHVFGQVRHHLVPGGRGVDAEGVLERGPVGVDGGLRGAARQGRGGVISTRSF
ncbi:MAG: hypothetical protein RBS21_08220 [Corynebacterium sp.]|jgi:hypothetical protein|nr:hypothetical protein [Corynebacterium sp.]